MILLEGGGGGGWTVHVCTLLLLPAQCSIREPISPAPPPLYNHGKGPDATHVLIEILINIFGNFFLDFSILFIFQFSVSTTDTIPPKTFFAAT